MNKLYPKCDIIRSLHHISSIEPKLRKICSYAMLSIADRSTTKSKTSQETAWWQSMILFFFSWLNVQTLRQNDNIYNRIIKTKNRLAIGKWTFFSLYFHKLKMLKKKPYAEETETKKQFRIKRCSILSSFMALFRIAIKIVALRYSVCRQNKKKNPIIVGPPLVLSEYFFFALFSHLIQCCAVTIV